MYIQKKKVGTLLTTVISLNKPRGLFISSPRTVGILIEGVD